MAVVVAVAAAAIWIVTRPTGPEHSAAGPTRTVTAAPTPTPPPAPTPAVRTCLAGGPINPQLRSIATRHLPDLEVLAAQSFTCTLGTNARKNVVSESIAVRHGATVIEIQATRRVGDSGQYLPAPAGAGLVRLVSVDSQSAGLNVIVEAYGRAGTRLRVASLSELASDVSLQLIL